MRKLAVLLVSLFLVVGLSSCHHDFAAKNPLGLIPIVFWIVVGAIMAIYSLRLTFKKKK